MPRVCYPLVIAEDLAELARRERALRGRPTQARVRLLRLLKERRAASLLAAAPLVGYSVRQVNRWWQAYRQGGLAGLLAEPPRPGKRSRLTPEAWAGLEAEMVAGRIGTLAEARHYLHEHWGIVYRSLNGVWWQLQRRRARPKTGRRRHRRANPAEQQAYKRRLRRAAPGAAVPAGVGDG
jgi:transposase